MTREGKWPLAAAFAVVLATVLLAACGGSDSDSSSATTAASSGSTTTAGDGGGQSQDEQSQDGGSQGQAKDQAGSQDEQNGGGQGQSSSQDKQGGSGHSGNVSTPLKVSGGGSSQFRSKGGDNSIQEFGEEGESELQEVAEIVHSFYVTRAEEKWDAACSYLAKSNIEQLEQIASQAPQLKGAGCAEVLKAFTRPLPASVNREITTVDAGSFRRDGEQGFLIYYGAGHAAYAMPMRDEGGVWKVAALSGTTLG